MTATLWTREGEVVGTTDLQPVSEAVLWGARLFVLHREDTDRADYIERRLTVLPRCWVMSPRTS